MYLSAVPWGHLNEGQGDLALNPDQLRDCRGQCVTLPSRAWSARAASMCSVICVVAPVTAPLMGELAQQAGPVPLCPAGPQG